MAKDRVCMYKLSDGTSLNSYCEEHGYLYSGVYRRIMEYGETPDEAVKQYVARRGNKRTATKHFIDGVPLKDYCKQHNLNVNGVLSRVYSRKMSLEEAVKKPFGGKRK